MKEYTFAMTILPNESTSPIDGAGTLTLPWHWAQRKEPQGSPLRTCIARDHAPS